MKALIVYYSMSGNTEAVAKAIGREIHADLLSLEPEKDYPSSGFKKYFWGGKSAVMAEKPKLKPYQFDANKYDTIIFDLKDVLYVSSSGLRVFLDTDKKMIDTNKTVKFKNVPDSVMEIFDMTGFVGVLNFI